MESLCTLTKEPVASCGLFRTFALGYCYHYFGRTYHGHRQRSQELLSAKFHCLCIHTYLRYRLFFRCETRLKLHRQRHVEFNPVVRH